MTDSYDRGMAVRRAVLGDAHVDRATAAATEFTREFQDLITRYAWGEIWTRPGLDRKTRSCMVLTATIALGAWAEFRLHVGAAVRNGLTRVEIKEVILQAAIYCGVPAANHAFKEAAPIVAELGDGGSMRERGGPKAGPRARRRLARDLHDPAALDADRRPGQARPGAVRQPLRSRSDMDRC
jgi:4-carboxymuconolactone decarboxylase